MTKDQILELTRALKALGATHVEIGPDGRVKCDFPDEARPFLPVLPAPEPWRRRLVPPMATMYACPDSWEPSTTGGGTVRYGSSMEGVTKQ